MKYLWLVLGLLVSSMSFAQPLRSTGSGADLKYKPYCSPDQHTKAGELMCGTISGIWLTPVRIENPASGVDYPFVSRDLFGGKKVYEFYDSTGVKVDESDIRCVNPIFQAGCVKDTELRKDKEWREYVEQRADLIASQKKNTQKILLLQDEIAEISTDMTAVKSGTKVVDDKIAYLFQKQKNLDELRAQIAQLQVDNTELDAQLSTLQQNGPVPPDDGSTDVETVPISLPPVIEPGLVEEPLIDGGGIAKGASRVRWWLDGSMAKTDDLVGLTIGWTRWAFNFVVLLAVLAIIYAGFLYIFSFGDESRVSTARQIIIYVVVGILLIFFAFAIVNTVISSVS